MTDYSNITAEDIKKASEEDGETLELHGWRSELVFDGLGTFKPVADWNLGDGREMGEVVQHAESGKFFMRTGWYSSWDSSEWDTDWVEAKPYDHVETRYKAV